MPEASHPSESDIIQTLYAPLPFLDEGSPGYVVARDVLPGELIRQFDQQTSASISGWLTHRFAASGWGVGVTVGRVGVATGSLGLSGSSRVQLSLEGTTRANLLGDGWIAVMDLLGGDVLRLVVPSEAAVQAMVMDTARSASIASRQWGGGLIPPTPNTAAFLTAAQWVAEHVLMDIGYVGDRFAAALRVPSGERGRATVVGLALNEHTLLGCAVRFGSEDRFYQLVPFPLIDRLIQAEQDIAAMRSLPNRR